MIGHCNFSGNRPEVSVVLSGMGAMQQVQENIQSAENSGVGILGDENLQVVEQLAGMAQKNLLIPCTACDYCQPCPSGVNVSMKLSSHQ